MPGAALIRIISDIHLGHPACAVADAGQLEPLFRGARTVVFNGDSVELRFLKGRQLGQQHAEALRRVCLDAGAQPLFINGNHDPILAEESHLDLVDGAVLVTHGDLLFHDISPWSMEAGIMNEAHTKALAELGDDLFHDFETRLKASKRAALAMELHKPRVPRGSLAGVMTVLRECWPPWRPLQILRCWAVAPAKAVALARVFRPRARVIIIGHTHLCGIWRRGPRIVINTGSFLSIGGHLAVDIIGDSVAVRRIARKAGCYRIGAEIARFTAAKLTAREGF